jgi:hypothetical protein
VNQTLKLQIPVIAVAIATAVATTRIVSRSSAPTPPPPIAQSGQPTQRPSLAGSAFTVRKHVREITLPSGTLAHGCGADFAASGSDATGSVTLGDGALGACEIIFSKRRAPVTCAVSDGHVDDLNGLHFFVRGVKSGKFAWSCK